MTIPITHAEVGRQTQLLVDVAALSGALRRGDIAESGHLLGKAIDNYPEIEAGLLSVTIASLTMLMDGDHLDLVNLKHAGQLTKSANARLAAMLKEAVQ